MTGGMRSFRVTAAGSGSTDTGWFDWTTGVPTGYTIQIRRIGPIVWVWIQGPSVSVPNGANTTIATGLPDGFTGAWASCSMNNLPALVTVSSSGSLIVRNQTGATRTNCYGLFSYPPAR